jgi:hypothetical protein
MSEKTLVKHLGRDRVQVAMARTINLGKYESIRLEVGFSSDVSSGETVDQAFDRVEKKVEKKLGAMVAPIEKQLEK